MKLLNEDHLKEYGFTEKPHASNNIIIKVMTFDNIDIVIKHDGIYYTNLGFDYPLKDTASLRKLYKELKSKELKAAH
jgi:hypothetical protein